MSTERQRVGSVQSAREYNTGGYGNAQAMGRAVSYERDRDREREYRTPPPPRYTAPQTEGRYDGEQRRNTAREYRDETAGREVYEMEEYSQHGRYYSNTGSHANGHGHARQTARSRAERGYDGGDEDEDEIDDDDDDLYSTPAPAPQPERERERGLRYQYEYQYEYPIGSAR